MELGQASSVKCSDMDNLWSHTRTAFMHCRVCWPGVSAVFWWFLKIFLTFKNPPLGGGRGVKHYCLRGIHGLSFSAFFQGQGEASARGTTMEGDCLSCIKYLMFVFNFLIFVSTFPPFSHRRSIWLLLQLVSVKWFRTGVCPLPVRLTNGATFAFH